MLETFSHKFTEFRGIPSNFNEFHGTEFHLLLPNFWQFRKSVDTGGHAVVPPIYWLIFCTLEQEVSTYGTEVRNSVYKQTRNFPEFCGVSRYFKVKSHGIPGNSAELKLLPHKILSSAECQIVNSVDTLIFHHHPFKYTKRTTVFSSNSIWERRSLFYFTQEHPSARI
jgi:hypothetical protein